MSERSSTEMAGTARLATLIEGVESAVVNPSNGLPEDVFRFVSRVTPLVNVDLLIKNEAQATLLTWRDDGFHSPGWHVPGGIVRYKEELRQRIAAVAAVELGAEVEFAQPPLAINEVIQPPTRTTRGHFISLLYACTLVRPPADHLRYRGGQPQHGQWAWHQQCPNDLMAVHEMYRKFCSP